jgi:hypothetical protein
MFIVRLDVIIFPRIYTIHELELKSRIIVVDPRIEVRGGATLLEAGGLGPP